MSTYAAPAALIAAAQEKAREEGRTVSDVIVDALRAYTGLAE
ncbi:hypothetical protein [Nocardioides fonticola]